MKEEKEELNEELNEDLQHLEALSKENEELNNKYVRLYAEFENHKKRFANQLNDIKIQTRYSTVKELLDIVDDITLSRNAAGSGDVEQWANGALLIFDKLDSYIKSVGLQEVECEIGSKFDPEVHDGISVIEMGEDKKGTIIDVVKRGYMIDGKIVKYPQVVVGK